MYSALRTTHAVANCSNLCREVEFWNPELVEGIGGNARKHVEGGIERRMSNPNLDMVLGHDSRPRDAVEVECCSGGSRHGVCLGSHSGLH